MVDQISLTKLCAKIIGGVLLVFSLLYIPGKKFAFMALMLSLAVAIVVPCLLFCKESNVKFLTRFMIFAANFAVFFAQSVSGHYEPAVPLFLCLGALSAMYFDPKLTKFSFMTSAVMFVAECAVLSIRNGGLIAEGMVLAELFDCNIFGVCHGFVLCENRLPLF